jgi:hypothetical protein
MAQIRPVTGMTLLGQFWMTRHDPRQTLVTALLLGAFSLSACGGDSDTGEAQPAASGGADGTTGGSGGTTGGSSGITAGSGGTTDCLGPDTPGTGGNAGGACDGVLSACDLSYESPAYLTCTWLMYDARQSVFDAVRECLVNTPDLCSADQDAKVAACTDSAFARACLAPGATVGENPVDCTALNSGCPDVSEQECNQLMSILKEDNRQQAYECYFGGMPPQTDCAAAFYACVGKPE